MPYENRGHYAPVWDCAAKIIDEAFLNPFRETREMARDGGFGMKFKLKPRKRGEPFIKIRIVSGKD